MTPRAGLDRVAGDAEAGRRIDVVLADWLGETRAAVQQRIADGAVAVDGRTVAKSHRVADGERLTVAADVPAAPAPPPPAVPVRHEDEHLLVVAKPAGLVVHAGSGTRETPTLVDALQSMGVPLAAGADVTRPGIVHRLDRGTSGLLVVAKTTAAREGLVATFQRHDVDRRYWVVADGVPDPPGATIDAPIARAQSNRTKFTVAASGRRAVTHYDVAEAFGRAAVLTVRLETGRTHQVRVHLSAIGHPVAGDTVYGASAALRAELGLTRPALHAAHLGFTHPVTREPIELDEPLPADLRAAYQRLGGG